MKIKQITIGGKPHIVGIGNHETGYGHFITYQHGRNIRADYLLGGFWSNVFKQITAEAVRVELDTDELLPFTDYFNPMNPNQEAGTATYKPVNGEPLGVKVVRNFPNESKGPRFDHYYAKPAAGLSGENLNATALALHILINLDGGWVLNDAGEIVQPVRFGLEFLPRETEESPYRLKVLPIDFAGNLADLQYSNTGLPADWQHSPEITFTNPDGKAVFVMDSEGTKAAIPLNSANWPPVPEPENLPE